MYIIVSKLRFVVGFPIRQPNFVVLASNIEVRIWG